MKGGCQELSLLCCSGKLQGLMMRERQWRAWSFFQKGAAYPWMGVIKINKDAPGRSHKGSVSCGLPHPSSLKEGWQGQNKTKIPNKASVWQNSHWIFFFKSDESVLIDEMILNILKEPEQNSSTQRGRALLLSPSSEWSPFHCTERRELLWQLAFQFGDSDYHHRGLFLPSYDEIYIHAVEAAIWALFGQNPKRKERIDFNLF